MRDKGFVQGQEPNFLLHYRTKPYYSHGPTSHTDEQHSHISLLDQIYDKYQTQHNNSHLTINIVCTVSLGQNLNLTKSIYTNKIICNCIFLEKNCISFSARLFKVITLCQQS